MPSNSQGEVGIRSAWYIATGLALVVALAVGFAGAMALRGPARSSESLLEEARLQLTRGEHQRAEELARQAATGNNASPWALIVAAEAALKTNRFADAFDYYQRVPRDSADVAASADFGEAEALCHLGRIAESEFRLRRMLEQNPRHGLAHLRLAFLLNITGRRWQAQPHLLYLVQNRAANIEHLLLLGNSQRQIEDRALLDATAHQFPDDPLPKLGAARVALTLNQRDEARRLLAAVKRQRPDEPEGHVREGQLLLDDADPNGFVRWSQSLPTAVETHPDVWLLRGLFAIRRDEPRVAVRCFWEAVRRDPDHLAACHQLGRTLTDLNEATRAAPFLERAALLQSLSLVLDDLFHHRDHVESMRRAALLTARLGRLWEAASWASLALDRDSQLEWAIEMLRSVSPLLNPDLPQTRLENSPAHQISLSEFPRPEWNVESDPSTVPASLADAAAHIHFIDDTAAAGIDFRYENGADPATPGARIFETTGGGVGVLDYDGDGWPDLYFTQGGRDPHGKSTSDIDRLFQNRRGESFLDVTRQARLGDADFSQGVAIGDFDNDGFADLYVANLGPNRLYRNNGDGTFAEVATGASESDSSWTTSCLMADLNGDGLPDLYDVNYASGESLLTRVCERQGVLRSCSPRAFDPAPDRLWLNLGDGRFRDASGDSGIDVPNGYGLGIVAVDLTNDGRLSLFVANDEVPNFLFVNQTGPSDHSPRFEERALLAGVALDADGRSQACMGVAAGDADGDGLLDLFVTNFYQESNTLYRQLAPGHFADVTRTARLRDPSYAMLGFGAQFLDADLDGWEDLVVTNGHIDDLSSIGEPYKMPAQFFRNVGSTRFVEAPNRTLGPFFEQPRLGRGLARLDWNRDGREDFAVSHIGDTASLVTNSTQPHGHFLAVQLRGTRSSRDAIGTTVAVTVAGVRRVRQLTAGDGYQASNERQLVFGLGEASQIDDLRIRWPSGAVQSWQNLAVDQCVLTVEQNHNLRPIHSNH